MTTPTILRRLLPLATALAAALTAPALAHADAVVADLARDTPIAAYGGVVAWSAYDPATNRYGLVIRRGDQTAPAAIARAADPFDVSLGPDARGRVVALYTRCRRGSRGCDVYRYDLRARTERRLASVSSPRFDEAWPVQWRNRIAFVRRAKTYVVDGYDHRPDPRGRRGGGPLLDCDIPFVKTLSSRAPSRRLDRGECGVTTGMSIRADSIVQVSDEDQGGAGSETQVRRLRARGGAALVLARAAGGEDGYSPFASPSQSATKVWVTRIGNREPLNFVRIDFAAPRKLTEVDPQVPLAGRVVRDDRGTFWYVQAPETEAEFYGEPPFCDDESALQPCRLMRASADPFSSRTRTLSPRLHLALSDFDEIAGLYTDDLAMTGSLTRATVRRGRVVRREPLPAVAVDLLRADAGGRYGATGLTTTTDAAGRWSIAITRPPSSGSFAATVRGAAITTRAVGVSADANVTLSATGTALSGTVTPAQPGRTAAIQRLEADGEGKLPNGLQRCERPDADGQRTCFDEAWVTVATAPLSAGGTAYSATAGGPGIYRAVLPPDPNSGTPQSDPDVYPGASRQVRIGG